MVNRDQTTLDDLLRHLMAALAVGVNDTTLSVWTLQEVAGITHVFVQCEVVMPFKVAVARITFDTDTIHGLIDVLAVPEFDPPKIKGRLIQGLHTVTTLPQTGCVCNGAIGLGAHTPHHTVHELGQAIELA